MRRRRLKGLVDGLLDAEEVLATIDAHDRQYALGLEDARDVLHAIAERENAHLRATLAADVQARIRHVCAEARR